MTLKDQLLELGLELAARISSQDGAVANARGATTEISRARVERASVELFLEQHASDRAAGLADTRPEISPQASGG